MEEKYKLDILGILVIFTWIYEHDLYYNIYIYYKSCSYIHGMNIHLSNFYLFFIIFYRNHFIYISFVLISYSFFKIL